MNFIAATVELRSFISDPINAYGLDYCGANAVLPVVVVSLQRFNSDSSVTIDKVQNLQTLKNGKQGQERL